MSGIGKPGSARREAWETAERNKTARRYWEKKLRTSEQKSAPTAVTTCVETIDGDPDTALRLSFQIKVF